MIKKRYVRRAYIESLFCDKCGSLMTPSGYMLAVFPPKWPYKCTNENCNFTCEGNEFYGGEMKYEFEEEWFDV